MLARDQQDNPRAHRQRLRNAAVQPLMRHRKRQAVEVDRHIGLDRPAPQLAVPA